jgi:uncharacterized membrane protein YdjX (TVP38/TMEM64 family)
MAGAVLTFWTGARIGEHGLDRYIAPKRVIAVRHRIRHAGSMGLAALDLVPPPFPFTPFILAAGALDLDTTRFFLTLAGCRLIRFGGEGVLASLYGRRLLVWAHSSLFNTLALAGCALAMALTVVSIAKAVASSRRRRRPAR